MLSQGYQGSDIVIKDVGVHAPMSCEDLGADVEHERIFRDRSEPGVRSTSEGTDSKMAPGSQIQTDFKHDARGRELAVCVCLKRTEGPEVPPEFPFEVREGNEKVAEE